MADRAIGWGDLALLLRQRQRWPATFRWDFMRFVNHRADGIVTGCAMGLAYVFWGPEVHSALAADVSKAEARWLFSDMTPEVGHTVTPEHFADLIDAMMVAREEGDPGCVPDGGPTHLDGLELPQVTDGEDFEAWLQPAANSMEDSDAA